MVESCVSPWVLWNGIFLKWGTDFLTCNPHPCPHYFRRLLQVCACLFQSTKSQIPSVCCTSGKPPAPVLPLSKCCCLTSLQRCAENFALCALHLWALEKIMLFTSYIAELWKAFVDMEGIHLMDSVHNRWVVIAQNAGTGRWKRESRHLKWIK